MNNYLKGYLASIPENEYNNIIDFLRDNIVDKLNISEEQFELLLAQITVDKQPATSSRVVLYNEKPSDTYNDFFSKVYIDLNYLFKVINLLYNAVDGYSNLSSSYLSEIQREIDKLESMVNEIKAREEYNSNAIIVTETFKNTEYFEDYATASSLFCDRDGTQLEDVDLIHNNTNDMIILNVTVDNDLLHASDGRPMGKIDVVDYRGIGTDTYCISSNAIDNSRASYWDCSVISEEPIVVSPAPMYAATEVGGAYIQFRVKLPNIYDITEICITPHCIYPVDICDVKIGDTSIVTLPVSNADTITLRSSRVSSDEITIVMRQKNYTHETTISNAKVDEITELWNRFLEKPKESYTSAPVKEAPADIYNYYVAKYESEVDAWNKEYIRQKEISK